MNIQEYIDNMVKIQKNLFSFLDYRSDIEENFTNLINLFNDLKIQESKPILTSFLRLLSKVSQYHYRTPGFHDKIDQILSFFKEDIIKQYTNQEIFGIFQKSKRILLFLLEEKMLIFDEYIFHIITKEKYMNYDYPQYFHPEIQPFLNEDFINKNLRWRNKFLIELPENFYENRKIGENESYICKLIRDDSIDEFITYVNKNEYSLNSKVDVSIYDTNSYVIKTNISYNRMSLISYAVFYGSTQIFNYLRKNGVALQSSLWTFAAHGNDEEIIRTLEENNISPDYIVPRLFWSNRKVITYKDIFFEAIKCHHNDVANYILNNYLSNNEEKSELAFIKSIKYYNFSFIEMKFYTSSSLFDLIKYDYYLFIKYLLQNKEVDFQATKIIKTNIFFNKIFVIKIHVIS